MINWKKVVSFSERIMISLFCCFPPVLYRLFEIKNCSPDTLFALLLSMQSMTRGLLQVE